VLVGYHLEGTLRAKEDWVGMQKIISMQFCQLQLPITIIDIAISSIPPSSGRVRLESLQRLIHVIDLPRHLVDVPIQLIHERSRLLVGCVLHCDSLPLFEVGVQPQLCRLQVDPIKTSRVRVLLSFRRSR